MTHETVLLHESIDALNVKPDGLYVDATYGRGGHSALLLSRLSSKGRLIVCDQDPHAIEDAKTKYPADQRVTVVHTNFRDLGEHLKSLELFGQIDGILFDLGVSSPQLDEAGRGFSFMRKGPLDMRMNNTAGLPLIEKLKTVDEAELSRIIFAYGEERFAKKIASAILAAVAVDALHSTQDLAELIARTIPQHLQDKHKHPATRTFQALRLWVNEELESLEAILNAFPDLLASGGYAAFISFHSLEDRLVKARMKALTEPPELPRGLPILEKERMHPHMEIYIKMQKPSSAEIKQNNRSRSAVLRVLRKVK